MKLILIKNFWTKCAAIAVLIGLAMASSVYGQLVTGSILGTVLDSAGSPIPKASVSLTSESTGAVRQVSAGTDGRFVFSAVKPGLYTLTVEHSGFKKYERKSLTLAASDVLGAGDIRLEIGALTESITVKAEGATVQTSGGERSGVITADQVENLTVINRDFASLVQLLPGVVYEPGTEVLGFGGTGTLYVQGGRGNGNNITVDGQPAENANAYDRNMFISMDSITAVKIVVSTFQAEFGRKPGASVQAITKSGTRSFHGAAFIYKRHEMFNSINFFNNRQGVRKPVERYMNGGFSIGGPLYVPGVFNRNKDKLFFFTTLELFRERRPQAIRQITMPTAMERQGDFSDSRDVNNAVIAVRDPLNNAQQFPGNVIPQSRINKNTQNYLNLLPLPNFFDTAISGRRYNFQAQESLTVPKYTTTSRVDYNMSAKTTFYGRFNYWWEDLQGWAVPAGNSNWGWLPNHYQNVTRSGILSVTHILSPSTVIEASGGFSLWTENGPPLHQADMDRLTRKNSGANLPQFYPQNNTYDLVPQATFSGVTGAVSTAYEYRFPINGREMPFTTSTNLTSTRGKHVFKAGFAAERWRANKGEFGSTTGGIQGLYRFDRDTTNPNDSNHPFSNALLGNFASYSEVTAKVSGYFRDTNLEWFAQDNWRVGRRLTLDLGVRFSWAQAWHTQRRAEAGFVKERWDPRQVVTLIRPAIVAGKRVGLNSLTGAVSPVVTIGAIAPGSGNITNGVVQTAQDSSLPDGLRDASGIYAAPRFGFAYDLKGDGKTALRGGFGLFNDTREAYQGGPIGLFRNPPIAFTPTVYYGNVDSLLSSSGYTFPSDITGVLQYRPLVQVINYSLGIQRNIGFNTVVDVAYVASLGRHLMWTQDQNSVPAGTNFLASSQDPTVAGRPLATAFLRPYTGYNNVRIYSNGATSNYNSLQVSGNRRYARGFQFGASWTWSKSMGYADTDQSSLISTLVDPRVWNYGRSGFDRTHIVKLNWIWDVPRASKLWKNGVVREVLDDWQVSGIASFVSGAPSGIGVSLTTTTDITGSPTDTAARVVLIGNPVLPRGDRTFSRNFNTEAFAPPALGTFGNGAKDLVRGPGINNFDISLFKKIAIPGERVKLQFRAELYNAFNHTQFSAFDTSARFDGQGRQTNARFGEFTAARQPRRMQLALRLSF
jgi:hypothetical protein